MTEADILNAKILIIDDAEANLKLLEDLLAREGFHQIISTADSTRALDLFKAFEPDLILLDLMMPELDGYAVLEMLSRHIPSDSYLPVLVVTADATIGAKRKALALGAKDFLTKPFDPYMLTQKITAAMEKSHQIKANQDFVATYERHEALLSEQERKIFGMILENQTSREIAETLGNSTRTIEIHRASIFKKMGVTSILDLAKNSERYALTKQA